MANDVASGMLWGNITYYTLGKPCLVSHFTRLSLPFISHLWCLSSLADNVLTVSLFAHAIVKPLYCCFANMLLAVLPRMAVSWHMLNIAFASSQLYRHRACVCFQVHVGLPS